MKYLHISLNITRAMAYNLHTYHKHVKYEMELIEFGILFVNTYDNFLNQFRLIAGRLWKDFFVLTANVLKLRKWKIHDQIVFFKFSFFFF